MKPNFELVDDNHEFQVNEEVYLIDNNKHDIYKAKIDKITKKGFFVNITDHEEDGPKKVLSNKRLLLMTPTNNAIYEEQEQMRKKVSEEIDKKPPVIKVENPQDIKVENPQENKVENPNEDKIAESEEKDQIESKEEQSEKNSEDQINDQINNENNSKKGLRHKVKRKRKAKKPIFDQQLIIRTAWHNGIHEVSQFQKFVKKNIKKLVSEFEKYYIMMNVTETPPFSLGGGLEDSDITKFWTNARNQWRKLFDDCESVNTEEFIKKTAATFKLQNQTESNARDALQFLFDSETPFSNSQTSFFQFCALLSLFGPTQTMFRKIGHFLQCPACLKDSFTYNDVADLKDPDENTYLNEFVLFTGSSKEKFVYNLPFASTDEQYIADDQGNKYDSWIKVFEEVINDKVEEETISINTPSSIPIEAS